MTERVPTTVIVGVVAAAAIGLLVWKVYEAENQRPAARVVAEAASPIREGEHRSLTLGMIDGVTGGAIARGEIEMIAPLRPSLTFSISDARPVEAFVPASGDSIVRISAHAPGYESFTLAFATSALAARADHRLALFRGGDRRAIAIDLAAPEGALAAEWTLWSVAGEIPPGAIHPPPEKAEGQVAAVAGRFVIRTRPLRFDGGLLFDVRTTREAPDGAVERLVFRREIERREGRAATIAGDPEGENTVDRTEAVIEFGRTRFSPPNVLGQVTDPGGRPVAGAVCSWRERFAMRTRTFRARGAGPVAMVENDLKTGASGRFRLRYEGDAGGERRPLAGRVDLFFPASEGEPRRSLGNPVRVDGPNVIALWSKDDP